MAIKYTFEVKIVPYEIIMKKTNMSAIFENFKVLRDDMRSKGWIIDAFNFVYKKQDYIVLVKLFLEKEKVPDFALLKVEIIQSNNFNKTITIPVNSNGFMIDARTLRLFFNIDFAENLGEILQQFSKHFSTFIPVQVSVNKSEILKERMTNSLSKSDSENPEKIYCFALKRNPLSKKRTVYNDNKTRILRPELYERFKNENTISFCYAADDLKSKSDEEIIKNFSLKQA